MSLNKLLLAGLASSSFLLTACGGGDSTPSNNAPNPTATPAPTTAPTAAPTPTPAPTAEPSPTPTPTAGVTKVQGPLDPLQEEVIDNVVVAQVGSQLPAPLDGVTSCVALALNHLIDGPDAILAGVEGLANGADPFDAFNASAAEAQAAFERFAGTLQASLTSLVNRGECSSEGDTAPVAGNPLAGTPLAPIGAALQGVITALQGEPGEDPNLTSLTNVVAPALDELAVQLTNALPAEVSNAPVLGAVFSTLTATLGNTADLLASTGAYDGVAATADVDTLINDLLSGVLLGVLPVSEVSPDAAAQIQDGINTLTGTLGGGIGRVITPLFNEGLDGVASPLLDPVEGLLASILGEGNPLEGLLATFAGNGAGSPADALFGVILSSTAGTPLQNLVIAAGGVATPTSSPLALLGQLQTVVGDIGNPGGLDGVLGNAVTQNNNLGATVGTILDTLLGDGGLLSGLFGN